jgi:hypothetical protein
MAIEIARLGLFQLNIVPPRIHSRMYLSLGTRTLLASNQNYIVFRSNSPGLKGNTMATPFTYRGPTPTPSSSYSIHLYTLSITPSSIITNMIKLKECRPDEGRDAYLLLFLPSYVGKSPVPIGHYDM